MKTPIAILISSSVIWVASLNAGCQQTTVRGQGEKSLTIQSAVLPVVIKRTEMQTIQVSVLRQGFSDSVKVDLTQLPAGVSVQNGSMDVQTDKATFILTASDKADLVANHKAMITAIGPGGIQAKQYVSVTVVE